MSDTRVRGASEEKSPDLVVDTEPPRIQQQRRSFWHWFGVPLAVVGLVVAAAAYINLGNLDATSEQELTASTLLTSTWEHIVLTGTATLAVLAIAVPLGIALTRPGTRAAAPIVVGLANIGQAAPSIGLLVLFAIGLSTGFWAAFLGLTVYAVLPVLRNTITGLQGIDEQLVEAGRGMGMSARMALVRIELPLAVPVILAGIRTALVLLVGTAALAGFIGAGGLGYYIDLGIKLQRPPAVLVGAVLIAALALLIDWIGQIIEDSARPKGV